MLKNSFFSDLRENLIRIGPAAIVTATAMGPGTIASCLLGGSSEGYRLLWFVACSGIFSAALAILGGKVYIVTGRSPLEVISNSSGNWLAYFVYLSVLLSGYYVVAVEGKLLNYIIQTMFPFLSNTGTAIIVLLTVLIIALTFTFGFKRIILICTLLSACMSLIFFFNFFIIDISVKELISGLIPRLPERKEGYLAMAGIMGGAAPGIIIMMYAYCIKNKGWNKVSDLKKMRWDQYIYSVLLFGLFSLGIYISGAAILYGEVIVGNLSQAAAALRPVAGKFGLSVFLVGLFMTVFTTIGGLSNVLSYFLADLIKIPSDLDNRKFKIILFTTILLAALGYFLGESPIMQHLPLAMIFFLLSGLICFAVYLVISNKKSVMGNHTNHWSYNVFLILLFIFDCIICVQAIVKVFR